MTNGSSGLLSYCLGSAKLVVCTEYAVEITFNDILNILCREMLIRALFS